jgi:hypothetical protein
MGGRSSSGRSHEFRVADAGGRPVGDAGRRRLPINGAAPPEGLRDLSAVFHDT